VDFCYLAGPFNCVLVQYFWQKLGLGGEVILLLNLSFCPLCLLAVVSAASLIQKQLQEAVTGSCLISGVSFSYL